MPGSQESIFIVMLGIDMGLLAAQGVAMRGELGPRDDANLAQHRDVTIMFADLAGSTELSRQLELERYHAVASRFLDHCAQCVERLGGYVARFMGDGVLAYFGYPQAHEDDAVRAVMAALEIRDGCVDLTREFGVSLDIRCGIASGPAIIGKAIGSGSAREVPVFGDIANLAARLQSATRPGTILVSTETRDRASSRFGFSRSPRLRLNGFPAIKHGWEATTGNEHSSPAVARTAPIDQMLIGRDAEHALFDADWRAACSGHGGTIEIHAEAGIGKSSLVRHWARSVSDGSVRHCFVAADPLHPQTPFHLVSAFLDRLGLAGAISTVSADAATLANRILEQVSPTPLLIVVEDLHWADPSSRDVIEALALALADRPVLMVTTSRTPPSRISTRIGVRHIALAALSEAQTLDLVTGLAGPRLSKRAREGIVARSGGVPLFAEELVRLVLAAPDTALSGAIPTTLSRLLKTRLTMLGRAMALAQCAAILGDKTPVAALEALAARRGIALAEGLRALDREGVASIAGDPAVVRFRHALYRDAALETLLSADRRSLYRDAAELLDNDTNRIVPDSVLAEFWREAGNPARALDALDRAVADAHRQRAWREVRQLAESALGLLRSTPPELSGIHRQLAMQTLLAEALQITVGYASPAARRAAAEAQRLAERVGEIDQSLVSIAGRWMAASSAGDYREARLIADQTMTLAQLHGGADAQAAAHMIDMTTRYRMGDLIGADASFRTGIAYFDAPAFLGRAGAIPQTFGNAALVATLTGDGAAARQRSAYALVAARRQSMPYDRCFAAYMVAMVEILLGADRKAAMLGAGALRLAGELGFPQFEAIARIVIGRARAGMGEVHTGMVLLREGLAAMAGIHARNAQTLYLTWLAEAALMAGDIDAALAATDAARTINPDERFYLPETLRIRALALFHRGAVAEATSLLEEGERLAIAMNAPWFTDRMKPLKARLGLLR